MYKIIKTCIKSVFKEIYLKLATNGQSDKTFLFTSTFCLQGAVCPIPWGYIHAVGERGGSVVECRTPEREVRGSKPTAAVLCP